MLSFFISEEGIKDLTRDTWHMNLSKTGRLEDKEDIHLSDKLCK